MNNAVEILLVEDNPYDAEMAISALKSKNLANNLLHVEDGAEAIDFIYGQGKFSTRNIEQQPRLILLDLKMPKVSGIEVLEQLKGDDTTKHIPIVVLTSSKEEKDIVESYKLGVNSYIVKPVDFNKFSESVVELGMYWILINQPPV